jgi:hypothetical protein
MFISLSMYAKTPGLSRGFGYISFSPGNTEAKRRIAPPPENRLPCRQLSIAGGFTMSYIDPKLSQYFDPLSEDLKSAILQRDVQLYTLTDLIHCLEAIVEEGEAA